MTKRIKPVILTLKKRVLLILVLFTVSVTAVLLLGWWQSSSAARRMNTEISGYSTVNDFADHFLLAQMALEQYWEETPAQPELLNSFYEHSQQAQQSLEVLGRLGKQTGEETARRVTALELLFESYQREVSRALSLMEGGREEAEQSCGDASAISLSVQQSAQQLLEHKLNGGEAFYQDLTRADHRLWVLQLCAIILTALVSVRMFLTILQILAPVQRLADASRAITEQDFSQPDLVVRQDDEVGRMAESFNRMKHSMKHSVETLKQKNEMALRLHRQEIQTLEMERLLEQARLAQLRSQINPHFLFNTLNVISHMAQIEQAPRTRTLVLSLAHLLRYSLESDDDQVTLAREVHIIEEYFSIYKVRFGDRVDLQWEMEPDLELNSALVPSFILQPLVENAFRHGIGPRLEGGTVYIRIRHRGQWLHISVRDDGVGMTPEQLDEQRARLNVRAGCSEHVGLYNVAERIRLSNPHSQIRLCSEKGKGTCVVIRMPWREVGTEEEEAQDEDETESV